MNIPQLLKDHDHGFLNLTFIRNYGDNLQAVISRMGFEIGLDELTAIDSVEAEGALTKLFSRDLAYGERVMDPDVARRYASGLIAECAAPGAKIFTNAPLEQ